MSRSIDRQYSAGSPPRNVTPLHYSRRGRYGYGADYYGRPSAPLVYQIHGPPPSTSSSDAALPFSPIRQAYYHPPHPPLETDLYSCFSPPPRRVESRPRTTPHAILSPARSSIFRSKQSSVLVDRDPSQDTSSVTYDSKDSSPPLQRPAEVTSSSNKEPAASALKTRQVTPRASESFPCKLHAILSNENYSDYISWLPHGRAFRVLKPKAFEEDVLPKYFRSTKFASFMRQVNGWGFKRITQPGPDFNAYWHELFLRGLPDVCTKMKRPQKSEVDAAKNTPTEDPNFYRMPPLPPSNSSASLDHHEIPGVDRTASISSISCEVFSKEAGYPTSELKLGPGHYLSSLDSWDIGHHHPTDGAVNLNGEYEKGAAKPSGKPHERLSEADLHYLIEQNKYLIKEAHKNQSRSSGHY